MKRTTIFTILIMICITTFFCTIGYNYHICASAAAKQSAPGTYTLNPDEKIYLINYPLAGKWEYYPDKLIISQDQNTKHSGHLNHMIPKSISKSDTARKSSVVPNPDADHISVPSSYDNIMTNFKSVSTKASYRLIVEGLHDANSDTFCLSFPGLISGNYQLYINGKPTMLRMTSPWGYPVYRMDDTSTTEIVLEVTNTSHILNVCPRLTFIGVSMKYFDTNRNVFFVMISMLTTTFIILLIFIFLVEPKYFRLYFLVGIIFTASFLLNTCWFTGYIDTITNYIPLYLLPLLAHLCFIGGITLTFFILKKQYPPLFTRTQSKCNLYLLVFASVFRTAALFSPIATVFSAVAGILITIFLFRWGIAFFKCISQIPLDVLLFQFGFLLLITGSTNNLIYSYYGAAWTTVYITPLCIIAFTICILISIKQYQYQLLKRTQELLVLEKQATKMQTAMLSSQIQPHFLYNTLTTIQEMCYTEPEQAAGLIVRFSRYLRTNIDFMDYTELIPFTKELEHIENYLYIQNARFGDSLIFEKHIETTDFMIPPLSVQPLIENAIKYGIRNNSDSGLIRLETRKTSRSIQIKIMNSGPGFDTETLKNNHSIENIRTRLMHLLHGKLIIHSSRDTDGTIVEILIPANDFTEKTILFSKEDDV